MKRVPVLPHELEAVSKRVTREAIRLYAEITADDNPIHLDPDFAAKTEMGGIIAHGMLSLNLVWQALARTLGNAAIAGTELDVRFTKPVRENDRVTARGRLRPGEDGVYDVWVENEAGEVVIRGTARPGRPATA